MTMPYSASRALFEGNGAATQFPFSFRVWEESQLVVSLTSPQGETSRAMGWTATLSDSGGTISYLHKGAPLPEGWKLAIVRNMPFSQDIDLVSGARFDPQVMEDGLDQAAAERQQLLEQLSRAVILPPSSEQSPQEVVEGITTDRERAERAAGGAAASALAAARSADEAADHTVTAAREADRARAEADRATEIANVGPATADKAGLVKIGDYIKVDAEGRIYLDPWAIYPPRSPIPVQGVAFGGSDGRRAIMPGETTAREDWILCDGGSDGRGGTVSQIGGRVVLGADESHPAGSTGGSGTHDHSISGTVGATTLTESQLANHQHQFRTGGNEQSSGAEATQGDYAWLGYTYSTGGSQAHAHSLAASSGAASSLSPYYALAYVIRIS